jgi:hypothetical protein
MRIVCNDQREVFRKEIFEIGTGVSLAFAKPVSTGIGITSTGTARQWLYDRPARMKHKYQHCAFILVTGQFGDKSTGRKKVALQNF